MSNIAVIIQGPLNDVYSLYKNINYLKRFVDEQDILISTWDNERNLHLLSDFNTGIILSDVKPIKKSCLHFPLINKNNYFFQTYSTAIGIANLIQRNEYEYIIKLRTDEYYEDYGALIEIICNNNRIVSSSLFYRNDIPFHIGDHVLAGPAEEMFLMFEKAIAELMRLRSQEYFLQELLSDKYSEILYNNTHADLCNMVPFKLTNITPEQRLTIAYLSQKEAMCDIKVENHPTFMKQYFTPFDVRLTKKYRCVANSLNRLVITEHNIGDLDTTIMTDPNFVCTDCLPHILCEKTINQANIIKLLRSIVTDNSTITALKDDSAIFNSLHAPHKVLPEFKNWRLPN
jgi:hypothetical protein